MANKLVLFGICIICGDSHCDLHGIMINCEECRHLRCPIANQPEKIMLQHIICEICADEGGINEEYSD